MSYEHKKDKAIEYMKISIDKGDIQSASNLAIIYLNSSIKYSFDSPEYILNKENFLKYNMIALNKNNHTAIINMGLYYHILKNYSKSTEYFYKLFECDSHEAYYIYCKIIEPKIDKIKFCMKAIKIKPYKQYIDYLKSITTMEQRSILYKKYNIDTNLDDTIKDIIIRPNSLCFICMKYNDLIQFKCNHSMCVDCVNTNCSICI